MLMCAYGWTLEEVMGLTFPQVHRLMIAIAKWPPVNVIVPALFEHLGHKDADAIAAKIGHAAEAIGGGEFLKQIGVEIDG